MATYQWRATTSYQSDTSLSYGSDGPTNWQTANTGDLSGSYTYWYRDANVASGGVYSDANSNRVAISITESWNASVDSMNNLTVTIITTLNSIVRDDLRGANQNSPGRHINVYREQGGAAVLSLTDTSAGTAHTIWSGPLTLAQYTFTLAPGQNATRSSLYVHNQTIGYSSYDDIWVGVQFRNPLPAPVLYTLNYNANGGSGAPNAQTAYSTTGSYTFTVPNTSPSWGLYQFLGWSWTQYSDSRTEADVEFVAGDTITLVESNPTRTLYAVWRKDYRPGATYSNGVWLGHERSGGKCHIYDGSGYFQMRTIGGEVNQKGNPPASYHDNSWYNMKRIGKE